MTSQNNKNDEIDEEFEGERKERPPIKELPYKDIYEANEVIRQLQEVIQQAGLTEGESAADLLKKASPPPAATTPQEPFREMITVVMPDGREFGFIHLVQLLQRMGRQKKPLTLKAKKASEDGSTYQVTEPVREQSS